MTVAGGEAKNTHRWSGAKVGIAPTGTQGPSDLTTPWTAAYKFVGLLKGEDGVTIARETDGGSDEYAWGSILYEQIDGKTKVTLKWVSLEDNDTTFKLTWPGSTQTISGGVIHREIKTPKAYECAIGIELEDGRGSVKRRWCERAKVEMTGEVKESEEGTTVYEYTATIFPDASGTLFHELLPAMTAEA